jgi:2'-5' RNA ligase
LSLIRVFISAEITAKEEISNLQDELLRRAQLDSLNIKVVDQENFHFTLVFIGEVTISSLEQIIAGLSSFNFSSFNFNFSRIGGFPDSKNANIVWIGVDKTGERKLFEIHRDILQELPSFAPSEKNIFVPHITLFRIKRGVLNVESMTAKIIQINIQDRINEITLKKSVLTPSGPKYSNIITVNGI